MLDTFNSKKTVKFKCSTFYFTEQLVQKKRIYWKISFSDLKQFQSQFLNMVSSYVAFKAVNCNCENNEIRKISFNILLYLVSSTR